MDEKAVYFLAEQIRELATATTLAVEAHRQTIELSKQITARQALTEANVALIQSRLNGDVAEAATWAERERCSSESTRLRAALRALARPLVEAASGSLEGPDIEDVLEKAGLITWTVYDADNPEHVKFLAAEGLYEIDDGDRFWRLTDFGKEVLVDH